MNSFKDSELTGANVPVIPYQQNIRIQSHAVDRHPSFRPPDTDIYVDKPPSSHARSRFVRSNSYVLSHFDFTISLEFASANMRLICSAFVFTFMAGAGVASAANDPAASTDEDYSLVCNRSVTYRGEKPIIKPADYVLELSVHYLGTESRRKVLGANDTEEAVMEDFVASYLDGNRVLGGRYKGSTYDASTTYDGDLSWGWSRDLDAFSTEYAGTTYLCDLRRPLPGNKAQGPFEARPYDRGGSGDRKYGSVILDRRNLVPDSVWSVTTRTDYTGHRQPVVKNYMVVCEAKQWSLAADDADEGLDIPTLATINPESRSPKVRLGHYRLMAAVCANKYEARL